MLCITLFFFDEKKSEHLQVSFAKESEKRRWGECPQAWLAWLSPWSLRDLDDWWLPRSWDSSIAPRPHLVGSPHPATWSYQLDLRVDIELQCDMVTM
jgi:hypothetical protein